MVREAESEDLPFSDLVCTSAGSTLLGRQCCSGLGGVLPRESTRFHQGVPFPVPCSQVVASKVLQAGPTGLL